MPSINRLSKGSVARTAALDCDIASGMGMHGKTQGPNQRRAVHLANLKHGYACARTEGKKRPEYKIWVAMRSRCANPNDTAFEHYGARGIQVCKRWMKFPNF